MIGWLKDLTVNRDGTQNVTVTVSADFSETYDELKDTAVTVEIKRYRKHRSRDANAYAWVLIDQITEKLQQKEPKAGWRPIDVYRNAIREIGGVSTIIGIRTDAVETFRRNWEANHLGRQVEIIDGSGKAGWSNVRVFWGSSEFDTAQMSRLISSLIQDAEALGIPTITDDEAGRLLGKWATKKNGGQDNDKSRVREDNTGKGPGIPGAQHG